MVSPALERLRRRRAQRGNVVMVVVLITMLLSAVSLFAVRQITMTDQAVGYARQAGQTAALAELGTTAGVAYLATLDRDKVQEAARNATYRCLANGVPPAGRAVTCYPFRAQDIDTGTALVGGETLLEPATSSESGSFGAAADMQGLVDLELTDIQPAFSYVQGRNIAGISGGGSGEGNKDQPLDATVTTRARVRPTPTSGAVCDATVANMTAKKILRAHTIF